MISCFLSSLLDLLHVSRIFRHKGDEEMDRRKNEQRRVAGSHKRDWGEAKTVVYKCSAMGNIIASECITTDFIG